MSHAGAREAWLSEGRQRRGRRVVRVRVCRACACVSCVCVRVCARVSCVCMCHACACVHVCHACACVCVCRARVCMCRACSRVCVCGGGACAHPLQIAPLSSETGRGSSAGRENGERGAEPGTRVKQVDRRHASVLCLSWLLPHPGDRGGHDLGHGAGRERSRRVVA